MLILSMLAIRPARGAKPSPDEQAARRHFERGALLYETERYREAIAEFEQARVVMPTPALDYNIGRAYERLEEWSAAADAFERYLRDAKNADDREAMASRIVTLRARSAAARASLPAHTSPPPQPVPSVGVTVAAAPLASASPRDTIDSRWRNAAIGVGVATGVLATIGASLVGSVGAEYDDREALCRKAACSVDDLRARLWSGYSMLGLASAALIADVALIVVTKRSAPSKQARIRPGLGGLTLGGAF